MTQYKFRGISTVTENWVYGSLLTRIDSFGEIMVIEVQDKEPPFETEYHHVKKETVGQYSNKNDSEQSEVYNGDIIQGGNGKMWEVIYSVKASSWIISNKRIKDNGRNKFAGNEEYSFDKYRQLCKSANTDTFKKIGNVFDNPELVNPPADSPALNTMQNLDPNTPQQEPNEEVKEQATEQATEQTESAATTATDSEEVAEG